MLGLDKDLYIPGLDNIRKTAFSLINPINM